jgi:cell division septal protein FtsQ
MRASKKDKQRRGAPSWRYLLALGLIGLALGGTIYAAQRIEQFLIRDARFALAPPADYGQDSPDLDIKGVKYASRTQIIRVFSPDLGRSVFLFPMAERRKALLRVAWVKDASILRAWPNHISVEIRERQPVAFVQLRSEGISRWSLIDSDGVILEPPAKAPFKLPVVNGVQAGESQATRGMRVRRVSRMLDEIGPEFRDKVSEADVSDLDNLKVTMKLRGRAVVLMLGDHNFRNRIQSVLDHFESISKRISDMAILDLRLDDRITVLGAGRNAE